MFPPSWWTRVMSCCVARDHHLERGDASLEPFPHPAQPTYLLEDQQLELAAYNSGTGSAPPEAQQSPRTNVSTQTPRDHPATRTSSQHQPHPHNGHQEPCVVQQPEASAWRYPAPHREVVPGGPSLSSRSSPGASDLRGWDNHNQIPGAGASRDVSTTSRRDSADEKQNRKRWLLKELKKLGR
ncbi:unnamed protein product, partial [Amoebophrya sp. A25]|eukprot:GSA25T00021080001.1